MLGQAQHPMDLIIERDTMSLITDKDYITLTDKLESLASHSRQKFLQMLGFGLRIGFVGYCNHGNISTQTPPIQIYGDWQWNRSPYHKKIEYYVGCFIAPQIEGGRWSCVHSSVWLSQRKRSRKDFAAYQESIDFKKGANTLGLYGFTQKDLLSTPHLVTADAIRKATFQLNESVDNKHAIRMYRYTILNAYGKSFATDDALVLVVLPSDPNQPLGPEQVLALSRTDLEMLMRYI